MINLNKKHLIFVLLVFFIFVHKVDANIVINEVQINPTENRFVELYNNGSDSVDLTGWYLQRKTATGSTFSSLVSKTYFEGKIIEPNSYFIITKTNLSNSNIAYDSLTLTESNSIQIKNDSGDIIDKVGWGDSNDCSGVCAPGPIENKSISRTSGSIWVVSSATPGFLNNESENKSNDNGGSSSDNVDNTTTNTSSFTSSSSSSLKIDQEVFKISTKIVSPKIVTAGIPFIIDHITTGKRKEKIILGKFIWNFGDGMKKELSTSNPFEYTYQYAGDYILTLSFFESILKDNPDSVDRIIIKVIPPGIVVSSVGTLLDPYIEIENNSNYEISLNDLIITGKIHSFVFPDGMIILPNKKLKLSPKITGFDFNDLSSILVIDNNGQIFAKYPNNIDSSKKYSTNKIFQGGSVKSDIVKNSQIEESTQVINLNDVSTNAGGSEDLNKNLYYWLGLVGVILLGSVSIVFIFRKKEYKDYIEEGLTAKDMTIIE